jgi:hypothetical protein
MAQKHFLSNTISELQEVNRNPIDGYQDLPVPTLEEAIQKITPPIPRIMDYVATAKKECKRNSKLLTWDESAAIYLYSMPISFFPCLNSALRVKNRHALKSWFAFLKLFITALEKLPSTKKTVWRGVEGDVGSIFADGDVHIWWSVNSCSMDLKVVESYLSDTSTVFAIDTIHGKDISAFSTFPDEQEIVLMPGTHLRARCRSLNYQKGFFLVHLEEENLQRLVGVKNN